MRFKENKGITLIALVITIIILIILAGISINLILGQNGVIGKAKKAKNDTEIAQEKEINALIGYEEKIDEMSKNIKIDASKVTFIPKDLNWNVKNVKEALDYLYNN